MTCLLTGGGARSRPYTKHTAENGEDEVVIAVDYGGVVVPGFQCRLRANLLKSATRPTRRAGQLARTADQRPSVCGAPAAVGCVQTRQRLLPSGHERLLELLNSKHCPVVGWNCRRRDRCCFDHLDNFDQRQPQDPNGPSQTGARR